MSGFFKVFSWIFHPLAAAFLSCFIVFLSGHYLTFINNKLISTILFIFFILTYVLPAIIIPLLYYQKVVPDLQFKERKSRPVIYFSVWIIYALSTFLMHHFQFPSLLQNLMLSYTILLTLVLIISLFFHLSVHTAAMGGIAGVVLFLSVFYNVDLRIEMIFILLLSGIIASARIYLSYHKPYQVYASFLLGFSSLMISMFVI